MKIESCVTLALTGTGGGGGGPAAFFFGGICGRHYQPGLCEIVNPDSCYEIVSP
jgi:hypothetical protein